MKKIFFFLLALLFSSSAWAYDAKIDGIYYKLNSSTKEAEVTYKDNVLVGSYSDSITIPEIVHHNNESYTVTSIGYSAFRFCKKMTSIIIPNTITQIKQYAFSSSGINNITIPSSVVSIGSKTFDGCYSLTQLTIENSNETLEFEAGGNSYYYEFEGCPLNEVYIGRNIAYSSVSPFLRMSSIEKVLLGNGITTLNSKLFLGCDNIKYIRIPQNITSIGTGVFSECSSLKVVEFEDGNIPLSFISSSSLPQFDGCSLDSVYLGRNISGEARWVFLRASVSSVMVGEYVDTIPFSLFSGRGVQYVHLSKNIQNIQEYSFAYNSIKDVYCYAESVPTTISNAFYNTSIENATLHVPNKSIHLYKQSSPWSSFGSFSGLYGSEYTLSYVLDGSEYKSYKLWEEEKIFPEEEPTKEGYTFSGWSEIPETMPACDVNITGTFTINKYKLTYIVDGEEYKSYDVEYGVNITPEQTPTKVGYTFSGWSEIPETMPAHDVTVTGSFTINQYQVTYIVDGEIFKTEYVEYASEITPPSVPEREGYSFAWNEYPETMPANDITITGQYTINSYKLFYVVDGVEYKSFDVVYNTAITPEADPTKEGYTFRGWSEIPETMPAHDVTVTGSFTINQYQVTYIVDGEIFKTEYVEYASEITPPSVPEREGYSFAWNEYPETMPANDITITGQYTINSYKLFYVVDGVEYKCYDIVYNTTITPEANPTKEGYTFSGWSEIPETMPAHDVTVTGSFSINSYKLTYMIDDKVYKETMYEYGATITPEPLPEGDYATFEWTDLPEKMPAHDVVVHASYTTEIIEVLMASQRNIRIYSPNGKKLNKLQKGLNIVVLDDGTVKRVVVK